MFPGFVTTYRDAELKLHLFYFSGINDDNTQMYRNINFNNLNIDYKYTKNSDGSFDFVFDKDPNELKCNLINCKTGEKTEYIFI